MKRFSVLFLLLIIVAGSMFFGCKKGDDDPFFSIRSRKTRIAGTYDITAKTESFKTVFPETDSLTKTPEQTDIVIAGTSYTKTVKFLGLASKLGGDSVLVNDYPKNTLTKSTGTISKNIITFDKKGPFNGVFEYKIVTEVTFPEDITPEPYKMTFTYTYKEEYRGSWDFLSGVDNYKKKERISLIYEDKQVTRTWVSRLKYDNEELTNPDANTSKDAYSFKYANGENSEVFHIKELRTKKMVFEREINNYETHGDYTTSNSGTMIETLEEPKKTK